MVTEGILRLFCTAASVHLVVVCDTAALAGSAMFTLADARSRLGR